jgi:hypothetical protein
MQVSTHARVAELADALDSKSEKRYAIVGFWQFHSTNTRFSSFQAASMPPTFDTRSWRVFSVCWCH